jgi:hypothetical protein
MVEVPSMRQNQRPSSIYLKIIQILLPVKAYHFIQLNTLAEYTLAEYTLAE